MRNDPTPDSLAGITLLDVKQLGAVLRIHPRSIWRLVARAEAGGAGFPQPLRIGPKTLRWKLADVREYLEALAEGGRP